MRRGARLLSCSVLLLGAALGPPPAHAAGLELRDGEASLKLAVLLQGWLLFDGQGAPSGNSLDTDLFLRRTGLLLIGQLNETVRFFLETDAPDLGRNGALGDGLQIQDAWVELALHEAFLIDLGLLLVPFSHHGMQGPVTLHAVDYHVPLLRYPRGSSRTWRDLGLMIRGGLVDRLLEYRLALLDGVHGDRGLATVEDANTGATWEEERDPRNPYDWPRLAGRVTLNIFDADGDAGAGGFYYDGVYLEITEDGVISPNRVLSLGASFDWQRDGNVLWGEAVAGEKRRVASRGDYWAVAGDLFLDWPLDEVGRFGATLQIDVYYYDHGSRAGTRRERAYYRGDRDRLMYTGMGLLGELGFRYDAYELLVGADWYEATRADGAEGDLLALFGGFNWWWIAHATSIKAQAGAAQSDGGDWEVTAILQAQLLF